MLLQAGLVAFAGILAGGVINILADDLPLRRRLRMPRYADGGRRPPLAWLGIGAFLFGLRNSHAPQSSSVELRTESPEHGSGDVLLSWRYPLTELAAAALMLLACAASRDNFDILAIPTLLRFVYAAFFVLITVIDLEHRRVPFAVALPLAALSLIDAAVATESAPGLLSAAIGGMAGFALFYLAYLGGVVFARALNRYREKSIQGHALGFGDVVLAAVVGLIVGFPNIFVAIAFALFAGAAGAIALLVARYVQTGGYQAYETIPFAPFIAAGAFVVMLFGNSFAFDLFAG